MRLKPIKAAWWGRSAYIATALLYAFSFPLHQVAQFAYFFSVPFLVWGYNCQHKRPLFWGAFAAGWSGWLITVFFLRHAWLGLPFAAAAYGGLYLGIWLFVASLGLKIAVKKDALSRLVMLMGIAGLWVILEWARGSLLSGYPWLPLAASQWESPVLLQILEWTGAYGLSFILIFFNLTIASFIIRLNNSLKQKNIPLRLQVRLPVEAYFAILFLIIDILVFLRTLPQKENQAFAFRAGLVQPDIAAILKWDQSFFFDNLRVLREETLKLKPLDPDLVIWPECALPSALNHDENMRLWIEGLVNELNVPFLIGALAMEPHNRWYNAIFKVTPKEGISPIYYSKQKRTPFGEYIPLRKYLPFINKIVPMDFDLTAGDYKDPLEVDINNQQWKISGLICYEDIFSKLAREAVIRGAEFLLVITNDAWFRTEGGAYQHAANSVLRAVEVRRPVIRCGNNGWSGWINEQGKIQNILSDSNSIYFKGEGVFPIFQDVSWKGNLTFYTKYGDWFVILSAFLTFCGTILAWKKDEV